MGNQPDKGWQLTLFIMRAIVLCIALLSIPVCTPAPKRQIGKCKMTTSDTLEVIEDYYNSRADKEHVYRNDNTSIESW